ncbi:unnamed protein product [Arabis nemorensis]|uniref:Uncharacterized protein n=1 Tax=Arabis nemorensis TaxID=586526 RepID=A0A565BMK2_9BRAS|nr:unnamed protein product [Arabis nemorensis]
MYVTDENYQGRLDMIKPNLSRNRRKMKEHAKTSPCSVEKYEDDALDFDSNTRLVGTYMFGRMFPSHTFRHDTGRRQFRALWVDFTYLGF